MCLSFVWLNYIISYSRIVLIIKNIQKHPMNRSRNSSRNATVWCTKLLNFKTNLEENHKFVTFWTTGQFWNDLKKKLEFSFTKSIHPRERNIRVRRLSNRKQAAKCQQLFLRSHFPVEVNIFSYVAIFLLIRIPVVTILVWFKRWMNTAMHILLFLLINGYFWKTRC